METGSTVPKIFVTGGSGFVGSHVVSQALERGWNVVCTIRDIEQREDVYTAVAAKAAPGASLKFVEMDLLSTLIDRHAQNAAAVLPC